MLRFFYWFHQHSYGWNDRPFSSYWDHQFFLVKSQKISDPNPSSSNRILPRHKTNNSIDHRTERRQSNQNWGRNKTSASLSPWRACQWGGRCRRSGRPRRRWSCCSPAPRSRGRQGWPCRSPPPGSPLPSAAAAGTTTILGSAASSNPSWLFFFFCFLKINSREGGEGKF